MTDAEIEAQIAKFATDPFFKSLEVSESQQMFNSACAFHIAAIRACEDVVVDGKTSSLMLPGIVNFAFAAELYLKTLVVLKKKSAHGHKLRILFARLDDAERGMVADHYLNLCGRTRPELERDIGVFTNAFVEWRYVYEKTQLAIPLRRLAAFVEALLNTTVSQSGTWKPHEELATKLPAAREAWTNVVSFGNGLSFRAKPAS